MNSIHIPQALVKRTRELEEMAIAPYAIGVFFPVGCRRLSCWHWPNPPEAPKRGVYLWDSGDLIRVRRITNDLTFWFERIPRSVWDTGAVRGDSPCPPARRGCVVGGG